MNIIRKRILSLTIILVTFSCVNKSDASSQLDSTLAVRVIELITLEQYDEALQLADSILHSDPQDPAGWFLRASILSSRAVDFEDDLDDAALISAADTVISICSRLIAKGDSSASLRFYIGSIHGYLSFRSYKRDRLFRAYSMSRKMAKWYREAIDLDSTYWDAYLGLGVYYYHSSDKAGILRSLGLVRDRREEGLGFIKLSRDRGNFTSQAARSHLAWLAIKNENFAEAFRITEEMLELYPDRRAILFCRGTAQMKAGIWEDAISTYKSILSSIRSEKRNNKFNEIECLHAICIANAALGRWDEVVAHSDEAMRLKLSDKVKKRKAKEMRQIKKLNTKGLRYIENL